jgi:glycosyltransferase involved in cell wall biosynthesis
VEAARSERLVAQSAFGLEVDATLRLLVVTDSLSNGGAERQLSLTVTNLPEEWRVRCFSLGDGPFAAHLLERGIDLEVVERRWRYDPLPFLRLWSIVSRWHPDLVQSWGYMTTLAGFPIYRALGIPYIDSSIRTGDVELLRSLWCRAGINRASLVVANSQCGLLSAGVSLKRSRVIRNGFDESRIPSVSPPRQDDRFTIIMAARMHRAKDFASFFAAARQIVADLGSTAMRFVALGDGPERASLQLGAQDLVAAGVLEFGFATEVMSELLVSDCGVLMTSPSRLEGCSNTILEYMACGLPVVCSKGGGTDELVVHGETGFLVAAGDSRGLAAKLRWVYSNPDAARAMGARASATVKRDYSVEAMISATLDAYSEALARD